MNYRVGMLVYGDSRQFEVGLSLQDKIQENRKFSQSEILKITKKLPIMHKSDTSFGEE